LLDEYFRTNFESNGTPNVPRNIPALKTNNKNRRNALEFITTKGVEVSKNFLLGPEATSLLDFNNPLKNFSLSSLTSKF
jgi:hypothetical protein